MTDAAPVDFVAVVPARLASTRLPMKPLADIAGRPMVVHVADRAKASGASRVVVAADDARIVDAVQHAGHEAMLTDPSHRSGTDRIAEAARRLALPDDTIVVNVQGDEPLIDPGTVARCAATLAAARDCSMATASHPLASYDELVDPNVVKVVVDRGGRALYFSRAPIPWDRDGFAHAAHDASTPQAVVAQRHIGLYAYRAGFLATFASLAPSPLETIEALEQLRALWHGHRIVLFETAALPAPGVDTMEDLMRVRALVAAAHRG